MGILLVKVSVIAYHWEKEGVYAFHLLSVSVSASFSLTERVSVFHSFKESVYAFHLLMMSVVASHSLKGSVNAFHLRNERAERITRLRRVWAVFTCSRRV